MPNVNATMISSEFSDLVQNAVATILQYKKLVAIIFAVVVVIGCIAAFSMSKKYTAVSTLLIQDVPLQIVPDDENNRSFQRDDLEISTQRELLLSRDLAKRVIEQTKAPITLTKYMSKFDVEGGVRSRILNVSFEDKDPKMAAKIVNAHVDAYMESEITARRDQINSIKAKADAMIDALKETRAKKSQLAQDLRQENDLIKGRGSEELIYGQISDISSQIPPIESKKFAIQSRLDALNKSDSPATVSDIVNSYLIQQLKVEENKREQEYQLLRSDLGSGNPDLVAARKALQAASGAITAEIANVKTSLENELVELQSQEDELNSRLKELGKRANFQQGKMIKLKELELEEAASQKLLDGLLERYEQVQSQASFLQPKARIVARAVAPDHPSGPNRMLIIIMSVIFAAGLSVLTVLFLELQRSGIKNFADVRALFDREPLGVMPKFAKGTDARAALDIPSNKEAIKKIILKAVLPHKGGSILITSARQQEGRSTLTAVLAYYLALSGHSVLVIGIDTLGTATPFLSHAVGRGGIHEILRGEGGFQDYARPVEAGLTYLPLGRSDFASSELILSDSFSILLKSLQAQFDYVLIDAAPVLSHGEIENIAAKADGVILVVEWLKTKPATLKHAIGILQSSSANILGVVLSKVDIENYKRLNPDADFLLPRLYRI